MMDRKLGLLLGQSTVCAIDAYLYGYYIGSAAGYASATAIWRRPEDFQLAGQDDSFLISIHFSLLVTSIVFVLSLLLRSNRSWILSLIAVSASVLIYVRWAALLVLNSELPLVANVLNTTLPMDWVRFALALTIFGLSFYERLSLKGEG